MTPDEARDALLDEAPPRSAALLIEALRALPPPSDEELPWCASAEDPRCSPLPAQSTPPELAVRVLAATVVNDKTTLASAPAREITHVACADGLPPASGVHVRVERPPR